MSTTVTYKGNTIATVSNQTKTLKTQGKYMEGDVTLTDVSQAAPNLQAKTNIAPTTSSRTITPDSGYDGLSSVQINAMPTGTAGTPTAIKGTVNNNAVTVTPSVTNTTGYITGGTKTGVEVSVSASELVSGTLSITQNGTADVTNYSSVNVDVSSGGIDTSDATALASDIRLSKTAYARGEKITGTNANNADTSNDTAKASDVAYGKTFHLANGNAAVGSATTFVNPIGQQNDVTFIDYDGTILYGYSASDFLALSAMPANPSHAGLAADGWNWTFADAKTYVTQYGRLLVGQLYRTSSGMLEIDIELQEGRTTPTLGLYLNSSTRIYWGDGTSETITGSSTSTVTTKQHDYLAAGTYTISIDSASGVRVKGTSGIGSQLLYSGTTTANSANRAYQASIKAIRKDQVTFPITLDSYAFKNCVNLKSFAGYTATPEYGFDGCYNLRGFTVRNYGNAYMFQNCYGLQRIALAKYNNSNVIANYTFYNCYSLSDITIPDNITSIGSYAFYNCYSLSRIIVPSSVTFLGNYVFRNCMSLMEIELYATITSIPQYAFADCRSLPKITIPNTVTTINNYAFQNCYSLAEIHFKSLTPPTLSNTNVFSNIPADCVFYVPAASLNDYKTANIWSDYASRMVAE